MKPALELRRFAKLRTSPPAPATNVIASAISETIMAPNHRCVPRPAVVAETQRGNDEIRDELESTQIAAGKVISSVEHRGNMETLEGRYEVPGRAVIPDPGGVNSDCIRPAVRTPVESARRGSVSGPTYGRLVRESRKARHRRRPDELCLVSHGRTVRARPSSAQTCHARQ